MRWAALIIVALVMLATVVTGREREPPIASVRATYAPAPDFALPVRERREDVEDLFSVPQPLAPPPPPPAPKVEVVPAAPPLPFSYLGSMKKGGRLTLYLLRNQEMLIAEEGATLEGAYRLERITETTAHFVYLPLGTAQTLTIPPAP